MILVMVHSFCSDVIFFPLLFGRGFFSKYFSKISIFFFLSRPFGHENDILKIYYGGGDSVMRKEKQAMPITEGWKLYQALPDVEVLGC